MFCTQCGSQVEDGRNFCTRCGAPMQTTNAAPGGFQPYQPAQPQPPKKGPKASTIVIIVASIVIVAAAAVLAAVLIMPQFTSGSDSTSSSSSSVKSESKSSSGSTASSSSTSSSASSASASSSTASSASSSSSNAASNASSNDIVEQAKKGMLNHSGYILPTDTKAFSKSELEKLDDHTLFLARNEIYARHGRKFAKEELQTYFAQKSWYKPTVEPSNFQDSWLNDTERQNANTMLEIEKARNSQYLS